MVSLTYSVLHSLGMLMLVSLVWLFYFAGVLGNLMRYIPRIWSRLTDTGELTPEEASKCAELMAQILSSYADMVNRSGSEYIDIQAVKDTRDAIASVDALLSRSGLRREVTKKHREELRKVRLIKEALATIRDEGNKRYLTTAKVRYGDLLGSVEGHALDDQQQEAILREDNNLLVVAGAGSGKTTTIVGRVKYLLKTTRLRPSEILVVSFTRASAEEMGKRIEAEVDAELDVMTFHKLGLDIVSAVEGAKPSVSDESISRFVRDAFDELIETDEYARLLINYLVSHVRPYRDPFEFSSESEYDSVLKETAISLKGERLKSFEEVEIANYLFVNGIQYEYERPYEIPTATPEFSQYQPDFYLPQFGIYIEHFAVNRKGHVPDFFRGQGRKTAQEVYQEGMRWKRNLHREHGTTLIETYSYDKAEGQLLQRLSEKLVSAGVTSVPLTSHDLREQFRKQGSDALSGLVELMATFLNLARSNNIADESLRERNRQLFVAAAQQRGEAFLTLYQPIRDRYVAELGRLERIDFSDMINRATSYIKEGKFKPSYKEIIIDEYQDISRSRYALIEAIRGICSARLICVGDDWQSIYRFAGSDVNFFLAFQEYWGPTQQCLIEQTYRFPQDLADVSGKFVMRNPHQIRKSLKGLGHDVVGSWSIMESSSRAWVGRDIKQSLIGLPRGANVLLLGRYIRDIDIVSGDDFRHQARSNRCTFVPRPDLVIQFLTIHRSKGLQADYVFVLNNLSGSYGFPSNIQDDVLLSLVLQRPEGFPLAEERRLFYVAITRAKRHVWIATAKDQRSAFIQVLTTTMPLSEAKTRKKALLCPGCGSRLSRKKGPYGMFWGCSAYPECSYTRNIGSKL